MSRKIRRTEIHRRRVRRLKRMRLARKAARASRQKSPQAHAG